MANHNPSASEQEDLGKKPYPKRTSRKKVFFDGETWEGKQKHTRKKVDTKLNNTQPVMNNNDNTKN